MGSLIMYMDVSVCINEGISSSQFSKTLPILLLHRSIFQNPQTSISYHRIIVDNTIIIQGKKDAVVDNTIIIEGPSWIIMKDWQISFKS
ncbi:hypothetical protein QVD17_20142 [Tagetes erecta]|uniref:Uncharacterized protein n=1 Tax=Tagetes erecta TaxID=13708 RepID=A0AAD8NXX4_TARER|nr:hypothetical protein QVD17_20142 [Tagetes erecta]